MRTTVTPDDYVQALDQKVMRYRDASSKDVLNDGLRSGYGEQAHTQHRRFAQQTQDLGCLLLDRANLNALADELEDRELMAKLAHGR
jgi:hypothetical protein